MANAFDKFDAPKASQGNPFDKFDAQPESRKNALTDTVHDVGIGTMRIPETATGLLDIPFGLAGVDRPVSKLADKAGELTGFTPGKWADEAEQRVYSPERQQSNQNVQQAWQDFEGGNKSFLGALGETVANPRSLAGNVVQSLPSMVAGGALGKAISAGSKIAPALGEGLTMAGQQMANIDVNADPQKAAALSLGTGLAGGVIGYGGSKIANKLGILDPDTLLSTGISATTKQPLSLGKRVGFGAAQEGVFEELPQSLVEQGAQNIAEDKPITQNMAQAATLGTLAGGVMGGAFNLMQPPHQQESKWQIPEFTDKKDGRMGPYPQWETPTATPSGPLGSALQTAGITPNATATSQTNLGSIGEQIATGTGEANAAYPNQEIGSKVGGLSAENIQSPIQTKAQEPSPRRTKNIQEKERELSSIKDEMQRNADNIKDSGWGLNNINEFLDNIETQGIDINNLSDSELLNMANSYKTINGLSPTQSEFSQEVSNERGIGINEIGNTNTANENYQSATRTNFQPTQEEISNGKSTNKTDEKTNQTRQEGLLDWEVPSSKPYYDGTFNSKQDAQKHIDEFGLKNRVIVKNKNDRFDVTIDPNAPLEVQYENNSRRTPETVSGTTGELQGIASGERGTNGGNVGGNTGDAGRVPNRGIGGNDSGQPVSGDSVDRVALGGENDLIQKETGDKAVIQTTGNARKTNKQKADAALPNTGINLSETSSGDRTPLRQELINRGMPEAKADILLNTLNNAPANIDKNSLAKGFAIDRTDKDNSHPEWINGIDFNREQTNASVPQQAAPNPNAATQTTSPQVATKPQPTDRPVSTEGDVKQPWQQTQKEAWESAGGNYDRITPEGKALHKLAVANAIDEGKSVPANVLADYPDLKQPVQKPEAFTNNEQTETEYKGVRIYPVKMRDGDRFAVETDENKERRLSGDRNRGGDELFKTIDEAKKQIDDNEIRKEQRAKYIAAAEEEEKKEQEAKAKKDDIDGFRDDAKPVIKALAIKALNKYINYKGKGTTVKDLVRQKVKDGETTSTEEEDKIKPMSRMAYFRADNKQQAEHDKRVKEAGKKTVYYVGNTDLGKTAYDYANYLINKMLSNVTENNFGNNGKINKAEAGITSLLESLDNFSGSTESHSINVARITAEFAAHLGIDEKSISQMSKAAALHDVGKMGVDKSILDAPRRLTDEERAAMAGHSSGGAETLKNAPKTIRKSAILAALHHHSASGRIEGLTPKQNNLVQVIKIADVFEALTAKDRQYRTPASRGEALITMLNDRGHYKGSLLKRFAMMQLKNHANDISAEDRAQILKLIGSNIEPTQPKGFHVAQTLVSKWAKLLKIDIPALAENSQEQGFNAFKTVNAISLSPEIYANLEAYSDAKVMKGVKDLAKEFASHVAESVFKNSAIADQQSVKDDFEKSGQDNFHQFLVDQSAYWLLKNEFTADVSTKSHGILREIANKIRTFWNNVERNFKAAPSVEEFLNGIVSGKVERNKLLYNTTSKLNEGKEDGNLSRPRRRIQGTVTETNGIGERESIIERGLGNGEKNSDNSFQSKKGIATEDLGTKSKDSGVGKVNNDLDAFKVKYENSNKDKKESLRQMVADMIVTKKQENKPYQNLVDRLAIMDAIDKGDTVDTSAIYSNVVEGHPLYETYPILRYLVPILIRSVSEADRKLINAQDLYTKINGEFRKAEYALKQAKTAAEKKKANAKLVELRDKQGNHPESIAALRDEVLPELQRLYKEAVKKYGETTEESDKLLNNPQPIKQPSNTEAAETKDEGVKQDKPQPQPKQEGVKFSKAENESVYDFADKVKKELGLQAFIVGENRNGDIDLTSLIVKKGEQKQGKGTEAMQRLIAYADSLGKRIILEPGQPNDNHGTTSRARLVKFYKRFGFIENKGRSIDYAMGAGKMYRDPQIKYSRTQSTKDAYEKRIDELFSGADAKRGQGVKVLDKSDMLDLLGYGGKPVRLVESKVLEGMYNHRLSKDDWKKVPEWLENPAMVFNSETKDGRLVFIAPDTVKGDLVRVIVQPTESAIDVHVLVNAYDASKTPISRWLSDGLLRYADRNKIPGLRRTVGRQLPEVNTYLSQGSKSSHSPNRESGHLLPSSNKVTYNSNKIVYTERDLVKYRNTNSAKLSTGSQNTGSTVEQVKSWLPRRVQKLIEAGKLKIVQSVEDLPEHLQERGTALYHAAWHGSPHDHDKFDSSKIGTGEGAQAFGYGHYFTDAKHIAEWYKEKLTQDAYKLVDKDGKPIRYNFPSATQSIQDEVLHLLAQHQNHEDAIEAVNDTTTYGGYFKDGLIKTLEDMRKKGVFAAYNEGKLYQVELAPTQDEYLDWDKPLSEQSDKVRSILGVKKNENLKRYYELRKEKYKDGGMKPSKDWTEQQEKELQSLMDEYQSSNDIAGKRYYEKIADSFSSQKAASEYLHSIGIRGIRYKAEGGKSDANNYVIFSDEDVSITAKYSKLSGVEALYDNKRDELYLVADMLNEGNLNAVLSHELYHRGLATDEKLKAAHTRLESYLKGRFNAAKKGYGTPIEKEAYQRVVNAETPVKDQLEEFSAYMVTAYQQRPESITGLLRKAFNDFVAAIRAFLIRNGLDLGFIKTLTPADLTALSKYGAKVASNKVVSGNLQPAKASTKAFPETITINGKERPTRNSNGQPIHSTEDGIRNFYKWFGDSEVVDNQGRPQVVYHGSPDVRGIFNEGFKGFSRGDVFFGTDNYGVANTYADPKRAFDYQNAEEHVIPLYVNLEKPMIIDANGMNWKETEKHVYEAKSKGYDGIIIKNSIDEYNNKVGSKKSTVFAFFKPNQAKSALDKDLVSRVDKNTLTGFGANNGEFSQDNLDIRFSQAPDQKSSLFQRWFGGSKMKRGGEPIKFYHGTNADFTVFDKGKLTGATNHTTAALGHFFTENKAEAYQYGNNVHEVFLSVKNPYVVTSDLLDKRMGDDPPKFADKLKAQGFDGLYVKDAKYAIIFDSSQAKLTSNQNPTFGNDIRYSISNNRNEYMLELYHGGDEKIEVLDRRGPYRSVFGSVDSQAARSHGDIISKFEIPRDKVIKGWLDYDAGYEATKNALDESLEENPMALDYLTPEEIYDIVVYEEESVIGEKELYFDTELMIELQALRADVAYKLGYYAVSVRDEHGTSYQILRSDKINEDEEPPNNSDIRYSVAAPTWAKEFADTATDKIRDHITTSKTFSALNNSVNTQAYKAWKDKDYKPVFDESIAFEQDIAKNANEAADLAPSLLPKLEGLVESAREIVKGYQRMRDAKAVGKAIFDTTQQNKKLMSYDQLKQAGLNDNQITMYQEFFAAVNKSLDDLVKSELYRAARALKLKPASQNLTPRQAANYYVQQIEDEPADFFDEDAQKLAKEFTDKVDQIDKLKREGYAPLQRFGQYTVNVQKEGKSDPEYFGMYETEAEANEDYRLLKEEYPDAVVTRGIMSQEDWQMFKGVTPETMETFAKLMGIDQEKAFQEYLKLGVNNRSALKRLIHRKGTKGYVYDPQRVLATFITSNARMASKNLHMGEMLDAISRIPKEKGDVKDEAVELYNYVQNPAAAGAAVRGALFSWYLGGSVAAAAVNLTQNFTTTYPALHQIGSAKQVALELGRAMKLAANPERLTGDIKTALNRAAEEGVTEPQELHMLYGESMRTGFAGMLKPLRPIMNFWGKFFSIAEAYNRRVAFIAAYNLAKSDPLLAQKFAEKYGIQNNPFKVAEQMVQDTQFIYSKTNRPDWARGAVGSTVFTFKMFTINYLEFLKKMPVKERSIALGVLLLLAGASGAPGADDLDDLIDTIGQSLGYNTNAKGWKEQHINKFILYGMSSVLPIDISSRVGVQNVIPGTALLKRSESNKMRDIMEIAGPAGSLGQKIVNAFDAASGRQGIGAKIMAAKDVALPKALSDLAKAYDMAETGMYRDSNGKKITDISTGDIIAKGIGFQPSKVAETRRPEQNYQQEKGLTVKVEGEIASLWADGVFEKDRSKVEEAKALLKDWNEKNPKTPIRIDMRQVLKRVSKMRENSAKRLIKSSPRELRNYAKESLK